MPPPPLPGAIGGNGGTKSPQPASPALVAPKSPMPSQPQQHSQPANPLTSEPKDKNKEKRIEYRESADIMDKLRAVVSKEDPMKLYTDFKKIGQGYEELLFAFVSAFVDKAYVLTARLALFMSPRSRRPRRSSPSSAWTSTTSQRRISSSTKSSSCARAPIPTLSTLTIATSSRRSFGS